VAIIFESRTDKRHDGAAESCRGSTSVVAPQPIVIGEAVGKQWRERAISKIKCPHSGPPLIRHA
jgi:hypothetical protein